MVKRVGKYELGKTLGEGTFGKVKYAIDTETGEAVAIKVLDKEKIVRQNMVDQIKKEISIMKMIEHPFIVNLIDVLASGTNIYMVIELVTGGELFYKLAAAGRFDEETARTYFQQLIIGVEYCHAQGITHRDLKPENILLDKNGTLKISDFGLSALMEDGEQQLLRTTCGTPNYVAPEVLADKGYEGAPADVWSCGVILFVFLAGSMPFEHKNTEVLFRKIQKGVFDMPTFFSPEAKDLIAKILVVDPKERITIDGIKEHPWFAVGFDAVKAEALEFDESLFNFGDVNEEGEEDDDNLMNVTNAFDLIARTGVFDLTRMLERNPPDRIVRYTRFTSNTAPDTLMNIIELLLKDMPVGYQTNLKDYSVRVRANSAKGGIISFTIKVYEMVDDIYLVDFQRTRGDIIEFTHMYKEMYQKCAGMIDVMKEGLDC